MSDIQVKVDLRERWKTVRDQGARASCLACAATDAHTHGHALSESLSAEFLFYQAGQRMPRGDVSAGLTFDAVDNALQAEGQPLEAEWPYQSVTPTPWTPPSVTRRWYGELTDLRAAVAGIEATLSGGTPVVIGLRLTSEFLAFVRRPYIIPSTGRGFGGHAVLAVGLGHEKANGTLILIRNSWGEAWGAKGHAWLAQRYLDDKLIGYRTLTPRSTT